MVLREKGDRPENYRSSTLHRPSTEKKKQETSGFHVNTKTQAKLRMTSRYLIFYHSESFEMILPFTAF